MTKTFHLLFNIAATAMLALTVSCSDDDFYTPDPSDTEDVQINKMVHHYLGEMYLWNDEYNTLTPDFSQGYKEFLSNNLLRLTTNTLDRKADENGNFSLYSYIERRRTASKETSGTTHSIAAAEKELEYSFGITGLTAINIINADSTRQVYFCVQGVYPETEAARNGVQRGNMISHIDGEQLTADNYADYYYALLQPEEAGSLTLTLDTLIDGTLQEVKRVELKSPASYCNPVLFTKVIDSQSHKIGYLVYDNFDAGFDQELYDAFASFRDQGITDLILDLRYNRGGRTTSANLLATCIVGEAGKDKVFSSIRYNEGRMNKRKGKRNDENFTFPDYSDLGISITSGCLGLSRVYIITTGRTASASELVINSLRGIDTEVIIIGKQTEGKNVGMEYKDLTASSGNVYRILPITFQTYNAKGESNYADGFAPDIEIDETNPYNQEKVFYLFRPYGDNKEPLYAKAIEQITGINPATDQPQKMAPAPPKALTNASLLSTPTLLRAGHEGMLK